MQQAADAAPEVRNGSGKGKPRSVTTPPPKPPRLKHETATVATNIKKPLATPLPLPATTTTTTSAESVLETLKHMPPPAPHSPTQTCRKKPKKQLHFQSPLPNARPIARPATPLPAPANVSSAAVAYAKNNNNKKHNSTRTSPKTTKVRKAATAARTKTPFTLATAAAASIKNRLAHGCSSLMYACQHGDIAAVLEQLRAQPDRIRQRDSHNKSALHYCAAQNVQTRDLVAAASIAIAAPELLESADEDGFTPLHLAVIQGNLAMVNLLLANKADVNAVDNEGHSVVHWATVCGEVEALRSVLSSGANVATPDINGGSPLHYAAQMCGASYDGKLGQANSSKLALEILGILVAHPQSSVDIQDKDGRQPLLWAASAGSANAVIALVKAGARVESADKDGLTALHCAASRGHTECIDTLISLCGAPTDLIDSNGCTALHYAVTLGHADATSRLLDLEADPNRQDRKGRTPAHCGCSKGQFETVKLLKERGANLWLRNAKGDLPVHEAASSGRRELVEWLLEMRSNQVNTTSNDGRSLLHIAATNDYTDMCKMTLDYGADINAIYRNSKGVVITPLDCALQKGHRSTAKFLQSNGGLPAGKLRLAARRANPFQDATSDAVRPLKYIEKEEVHDLRNSKKYVVYLKRSDSDGGGAAETEGNCSCSEQTYKKEQRYAHTCRRHRKQQLRRRTSSCGEPKETCRGKNCSDICRSKSNIEIRRRKSRERYASSSEWDEEGGDENDEDSCENCCYHKRQKHRVIRRRSTSSRRSKDLKDSDEDEAERKRSDRDSSPDKRAKRAVDGVPSKERSVKVEQDMPESTSRPGSKTSTRSRPLSATKRQTPPASAAKEGTFIKSPPQSAKSEAEAKESLESNAQMEMTDEEEHSKSEVVTTQVDVHRDADETSLKLSEEEEKKFSAEKDVSKEEEDELKTEVTEVITKEVDQVLKIAATAVNSSSKSNDESQESAQKSEEQKSSVEESQELKLTEPESQKVEESADKADNDTSEPKTDAITIPVETDKLPVLIETPATPMPTPIPTPQLTPTPSPGSDPPAKDANASTEDTSKGTSTKTAASTPIPIAAATPATKPAATLETKPTTPETAKSANTAAAAANATSKTTIASEDQKSQQREQESRRSFTLLPSDSADEEEHEAEEEPVRKSSFQVLKSDESVGELEDAPTHHHPGEEIEFSDSQVFKIVPKSDDELSAAEADPSNVDYDEDEEVEEDEEGDGAESSSPVRRFQGSGNRHGVGSASAEAAMATGAVLGVYDYSNGRKRRLKKRVKSGGKTRSGNWKSANESREGGAEVGATKDQDSGFEPSPRTMKTKIPTPRNIYTAHIPRRPIYTTLDGRSCSSRFENRKPGDKGACDMSAVTRSIQRNIRRYYMERKIFQHLLELKSLQIRSNKLNEAVLVKRAVDDYHKSCAALGGETGTRLRRYSFSEFTFKNFELFLYETLKTLQKPGTYNFQNINEVYEEAERRLSPDYNAYEKALQCTTKTHRCLHAAHAYTGIPCAAYIPMMNHHTMPKFGFGAYKKTGVGSFYLPKILTSGSGCGGGKVSLELSHGKSKQLISLPSDKLDSNKRYYVTFTVKDSGSSSGAGNGAAAGGAGDQDNAASTGK